MRDWLLALLRVPERPEPPPGAGDELETFRATRGFFHYSILMWFPKQVAAAIGLYFSLAFFGGMSEVEIAASQGVSTRTVSRAWRVARLFLARRLDEESA